MAGSTGARNGEKVDVDQMLDSKKTNKKQQAVQLLRTWLADSPIAVDGIKERAQAHGISTGTLQRAKEELDIISDKEKGVTLGMRVPRTQKRRVEASSY